MANPNVTFTERDGGLGIQPLADSAPLAIVGWSSSGTANAPALYQNVEALKTAFGTGPAVEAAATYIGKFARPVLFCRTGGTVAAANTAIATSVTGTSVVTITPTPTPTEDLDVVVRIVAGGTRGTAGITYQVSLDGGKNWGPVTALGVAVSIAVGAPANVTFALATGTLLAGDRFSTRTSAPQWNATELGTALDAVGANAAAWEQCFVIGAVDATAFDALEAKFVGWLAEGRPRSWFGHARVETIGETDAAYQTAIDAIFASKTSKMGSLARGACRSTSYVTPGRRYRRSALFAMLSQGAVLPHINIAAPKLGAVAGVSIRDDNSNVEEHDDAVTPTTDERFCTLRTHDNLPGVYVTRPRIFGNDTTDFQLVPHRRVLNRAHITARRRLVLRLNDVIVVSRATGFIVESQAREIEADINSALRTALLSTPMASDSTFVLSRTDNILSTRTLTGTLRVTPLGYAEFISVDLAFFNPALQTQVV